MLDRGRPPDDAVASALLPRETRAHPFAAVTGMAPQRVVPVRNVEGGEAGGGAHHRAARSVREALHCPTVWAARAASHDQEPAQQRP